MGRPIPDAVVRIWWGHTADPFSLPPGRQLTPPVLRLSPGHPLDAKRHNPPPLAPHLNPVRRHPRLREVPWRTPCPSCLSRQVKPLCGALDRQWEQPRSVWEGSPRLQPHRTRPVAIAEIRQRVPRLPAHVFAIVGVLGRHPLVT